MKKVYETPSVEKVEFQYRDQVVVASGTITITCGQTWHGEGSEASNCQLGSIVADSGITG